MEVSSLLKVLSTSDPHRDIHVIRCRLFDLLMLSKNGGNIEPALPTVVKLMALPDVFVKRTAGEIMAVHCKENQDITLLAINTLVQDCDDLNPLIRGISFKIIGNLSIHVISDIFSSSVTKGLGDRNVYVRRTAALAAIVLNKVSSSSVLEGDIWDSLYNHVRDEDSMTVASCLCAIEEICASDKGVVVSNKMGQYLIKNMSSYTTVVQRLILQFLTKFSPRTKSLVFESLNELDDNLSKSKSIAKTLCTLNLFCHLTCDLPHLKVKVHKVAWSTMTRILSGERSEELLSATLHFLTSTNFPVENVCQDVTKFLCHEHDAAYLINQKIKFLSRVINESNVDKVFGDFLSCVRTLGMKSVKNLLQNVADIVNHKKELRKACIRFLKQITDTNKSDIVEEVIQILPSMSMNDENIWMDLITSVEANHHLITSTQAQIALLQVIQSYPSYFTDVVDIFDEITKVIEDHKYSGTDSQMKQEQRINKEDKVYDWLKIIFLGATIQAFIVSPAKYQPYVVRTMDMCINDSNRHVREKGLFYYSYLYGKAEQLATEI